LNGNKFITRAKTLRLRIAAPENYIPRNTFSEVVYLNFKQFNRRVWEIRYNGHIYECARDGDKNQERNYRYDPEKR
jgi:hypothetical protein